MADKPSLGDVVVVSYTSGRLIHTAHMGVLERVAQRPTYPLSIRVASGGMYIAAWHEVRRPTPAELAAYQLDPVAAGKPRPG